MPAPSQGYAVNLSDVLIGQTTAPLGVGGTILLGPTSTRGLARLVIGAFANVDGSFVVEESFDGGLTYRQTGTGVDVTGGSTSTVFRPVTGSHVQVRYTNGAGGQATFEFRAALKAAS